MYQVRAFQEPKMSQDRGARVVRALGKRRAVPTFEQHVPKAVEDDRAQGLER